MASSKTTTQPQELMLVNDVPGEETRIAILENGHLEELFVERSSTATSVGNVYRGRVTNVELPFRPPSSTSVTHNVDSFISPICIRGISPPGKVPRMSVARLLAGIGRRFRKH